MTPKIPKGWRKLRKGTRLHKGDKYYHAEYGWTYCYGIGKAGWLIYIRRIKRQ